jgi:hypothetical protein
MNIPRASGTTRRSSSWLTAKLAQALAEFHPFPERIACDDAATLAVRQLYSESSDTALWYEVVRPYLQEHRAALANVYREHRADGYWSLLDAPEILLIFERAERDREQLRLSWSGPRDELRRVSDIWGVPL